jgi:hypothetical protein
MPDGMTILSDPTGKVYYAYIAITERSRQVLYVGLGPGDPLNDHKKHAFKPRSDKTNEYLRRTIRAFRLTQSQDVQFEKTCESDELEIIRETEKYWIEKIGLRYLCNIGEGGEYRGKMSDAEKRRAGEKSRRRAFEQHGVDSDTVVCTVIGTRKIVALPDSGKWGNYHTVCLKCGENGMFTRERMERRCLGGQRQDEQRNFQKAAKELPLLLKRQGSHNCEIKQTDR